MNEKLRKELLDLLKGALGAALMTGCMAALQYLGTHIPEVLQALSTVAAATIGVKTKFRV